MTTDPKSSSFSRQQSLWAAWVVAFVIGSAIAGVADGVAWWLGMAVLVACVPFAVYIVSQKAPTKAGK